MADIKDKAESENGARHPDSAKDYGLIAAATPPVKMRLYEPTAAYAVLTEDVSPKPVINKKPTWFEAVKIDYDMTTKNAYATGPIDLVIYDKPDPNEGPDQPQVPITITAEDSCEYFGSKDQVVFKGLNIKGIYGREIFETWYKGAMMVQSGIPLHKIITHRFDYTDFQKGFDVMRTGKSGKVILNWE